MEQLDWMTPVVSNRGGKRAGAGRNAAQPGRRMPHRERPEHSKREPVHVTVRVLPGVPNLRAWELAAVIGAGFRSMATSRRRQAVARRAVFRVVEFTIQRDHLHLLVEADDEAALSHGMQGVTASLARRINRLLGRQGAVFADRYHARALPTPTEVRRAIAYVLNNHRKHEGAPANSVDPLSSARWFPRWRDRLPAAKGSAPVPHTETWLMKWGWLERAGGLLRLEEGPAPAHQ
jgi:REP element-mobilizing transposase RayT